MDHDTDKQRAFCLHHRLGLVQRDGISVPIDPEQHVAAPDLLVVTDQDLGMTLTDFESWRPRLDSNQGPSA